ncbi:hypothetical protein D3C86_1292510 [compost metagenome]
MPTRLTLVTPTGATAVDIPDGYLVQDANGDYVPPERATAVLTYTATVDHPFTPFVDGGVPTILGVPQSFIYGVCRTEEVPVVEFPDDTIPIIPDPTGGQCICFVTCAGTNISYVKVIAIID